MLNRPRGTDIMLEEFAEPTHLFLEVEDEARHQLL
jgi:hypothetical protein